MPLQGGAEQPVQQGELRLPIIGFQHQLPCRPAHFPRKVRIADEPYAGLDPRCGRIDAEEVLA